MSDESRQWTDDERQALAALRSLSPALPSEQARARARQAFLQASGGVAQRPAPVRFAWPALAAAAVLAFLVVFGYRPVAHYTVTDLVVAEGVDAGGQILTAGSRLEPGTIRTAPGAEIEVLLGDGLRLRVLGGSEVTLPRPPGRWFGRSLPLAVEQGEVYGTSGARHPDYQVTISTPEARATLLGTTFAGFRTDEYTCFCLFSGGMQVDILQAGSTQLLPVGNRILVFRDGRPADVGPLNGMETMKLQMIQDVGVPATP